jgi:hypothetical protein
MMLFLLCNVDSCSCRAILNSWDTFERKRANYAEFLQNAVDGGDSSRCFTWKRQIVDYDKNSGQALHGIKALGEAIQKLRLSPESLTSVHADYLQLCLVAKIFKVGWKVFIGVRPIADLTRCTAGYPPFGAKNLENYKRRYAGDLFNSVDSYFLWF